MEPAFRQPNLAEHVGDHWFVVYCKRTKIVLHISISSAFCVDLLSVMVFVCYAYASFVAGLVPSSLAHGVLRIVAFLLICIGCRSRGMGCGRCLQRPFIDACVRDGPRT
jgi:hypothetical protein